MYWPVMRLVLAGHDYGSIRRGWTLGMVLRTIRAMDIQDKANELARRRAEEEARKK